jgi:hypothetical protein
VDHDPAGAAAGQPGDGPGEAGGLGGIDHDRHWWGDIGW